MAAAVFVELITDRGIFLPVDTDTALTYAGVALATIASSVGVALAKGRSDFPDVGSSVDLLEAVYASLTAAKRSAASVTQAQVRTALLASHHAAVHTTNDPIMVCTHRSWSSC